jgi:DNA-binding beta-propeller fold protein YncE
MRTYSLLAAFALLALYSCSENSSPAAKDYIITEKDLLPEGVAFDEATQTVYVGSTYKRKIIAIDKDGKITDFIKEAQDDIKSVIGMEVDNKRNCLWAISSEANQVLLLKNPRGTAWRSSVYQFNLDDGKLVKEYKLTK